MRSLLIFGLFLAFTLKLSAQSDSIIYEPNKINQFKIVPLPAIGSNPANGWLFGLAPSATWYMGNPATTKMSNLVGNFLYTTKKQWIFSSRSNIFLNENKVILIGDWRYFITSQPTFGLGSTTPNDAAENPNQPGVWWGEQQMDFRLIRFYEAIMKRIGDSKFYLGAGYHLDIHSKIQNFQDEEIATGDFDFSHDSYNESKGFDTEKYTLSGVSLNMVMENRDIAVSPYEKNFAWIQYKINPSFLGSDQSSSMLMLDYRHYINLSEKRKRNLIALWGFGNFVVSGNVPYMSLPSITWDMYGRSGRGYAQGRFRGESMIYTEAEWRFPLQREKETFGGTIFINGTSLSGANNQAMIGGNSNEKLFDKINPGYGVGLRVMINKQNRTTISADYGFGQKGNSGFYLNVNESF